MHVKIKKNGFAFHFFVEDKENIEMKSFLICIFFCGIEENDLIH